jgi:beta-1,4-galactosyltransferase 1
MEKFLKDENISFEILIIEQGDNKEFNRAKLLNVGYAEFPDFDYYAFHDVDMLPVDSDYSYVDGPTHLASRAEQFDYKLPYDGYFGGVTIFDKASFVKINGYSNEYWGWGAEDDDVLLRCSIMGVPTFRKDCKYRSLSHERKIDSVPYWTNVNKLRSFQSNPTENSIMKDGISTLKYTKKGEVRLSNSSRKITVIL